MFTLIKNEELIEASEKAEKEEQNHKKKAMIELSLIKINLTNAKYQLDQGEPLSQWCVDRMGQWSHTLNKYTDVLLGGPEDRIVFEIIALFEKVFSQQEVYADRSHLSIV